MYTPDLPTFRPSWLAKPTEESDWLDDEQWVPGGEQEVYDRARVGLFAALEPADGQVTMLPAYVPRCVVHAVAGRGYAIRYYQIESDLRCPDHLPDEIRETEPDVVVFVHYFGFPDPLFEQAAAAAREVGATVVENAARGLFGQDANGRPLGSTGDVALFSLHKLLPIPNGGLVVTQNGPLPPPERRRRELRDAVTSTVIGACRATGISPVKHEAARVRGRPTLTRATDDTCRISPGFAPGRLSRVGLGRTRPAEVSERRRTNYGALRKTLVDGGLDVVTPPASEGMSPYGVALNCSDWEARNRAYRTLVGRGLPAEILRWRPLAGDQPRSEFSGAYALRETLLVLPTHQQVTNRAIERMGKTVVETLATRR